MEKIETIGQMPPLESGSIHIWGVHVPGMLTRLEVLQAVLCKEEQEKAARFHREADRRSSIAARGALRVLLSGYTGIPAQEIAFGYSENGKPHLVPPVSSLPGGLAQSRLEAGDTVSFNVSHSGDWVVLAIGRNRNIGVDIETIRYDKDVMAIASRYFTVEETARMNDAEDSHAIFFSLWARKEAYVKACGSALFRELSSFTVPFEDGEKEGWHFSRLEAGSEYAAAVVTDKPLDAMPCYDFGGLKWDS